MTTMILPQSANEQAQEVKIKTENQNENSDPQRVNTNQYIELPRSKQQADLKRFFNESGIFASLFDEQVQEQSNFLLYVVLGSQFLLFVMILILIIKK